MKSVFILYILLLIICFSCWKDVPKDIITEQKMIEILTDIHIVREAQRFRNLGKTNDYSYDEQIAFLFNKHGITASKFKNSSEYYTRNGTRYRKILEAVYINIKELSEELTITKDSIQQVRPLHKDTIH